MNPQGSGLINTEYFASLTQQAQGCKTCEDLQRFSTEAMGSLQAQMGAIAENMAVFQPMLALLEPPTADPAKLLTWITDYISAVLTPQLKPAITMVAQIPVLTAAVAELASAIQDAAASLPSCSIDIEVPEMPDIPPLPPGII